MFKTPTRIATSITLVAMCLAATALVGQQNSTPKSELAIISKLVCQMIEKEHLSHLQIDDAISAKLVDGYIKDLEPQKLYFLQSDISEFNQYRTTLDDAVKQGNLEWAFNVFKKYKTRLDERMVVAHKLVDAPHDFTIKESMVYDAKELPW